MFGHSSKPVESNIWRFFNFDIYTGIYKAKSSLPQKARVVLHVWLRVHAEVAVQVALLIYLPVFLLHSFCTFKKKKKSSNWHIRTKRTFVPQVSITTCKMSSNFMPAILGYVFVPNLEDPAHVFWLVLVICNLRDCYSWGHCQIA